MEAEFKNFIIKKNLLKNSNKILLAVSGGPDSLAMLDLFLKIKDDFNLKIAVAHLDHMFREESKAEADFVEEFAQNKKINFFRKRVNLPEIIKEDNVSAEAAAREERFKFFKKILRKYNFDLLALAHHRDDQAETVLLNLFRGSGLQGLSGIQAKTEFKGMKIIHPMLNFSKNEILNYCQYNNLKACFDSSNSKNIYSRNIIRNKILPIIEKNINKNAKEVIARSSNLIASENEFLKKLAEDKYKKILIEKTKNKIVIDLKQFENFAQVIQRRIYRYIYQKLNNKLEDLYLDHILEIEKLLKNKKTGRGIDIPAGIRVEISYSTLVFLKDKNNGQSINKKLELSAKKELKIDNQRSLKIRIISRKDFSFTSNSKQAAFDYEKLNLPLFIRNRKAGDKLIPLGMEGHKKVKDILIDQKVSRYKRDQLLVIEDAEGKIIWLAPYKISDEHKITEKTDKVLILKLKYN